MKKIIVIAFSCCLACFGMFGLSACSGSSGGAPAKADTDMSLEEYNAIEDGMSYTQVVEIVGCEGTEQSSSNIEAGSYSVKTIMYTWEGNGGAGSNANVTFQNDEVVSKAQFGLK